MKSIHQKQIPDLGTVKRYSNGVVGIQQPGQPHNAYAKGMVTLKGINPSSNNLLSRTFGR